MYWNAAKWLLKLHSCGYAGGREYTFSRHLHTLKRWKRILTEIDPEYGCLFGEVLARVETRGLALPGWTPAPIHRDFSPDNLVVDRNKCTVLDLDEFCQYDPLFDVAHFATHVRFLGLSCFGALRRLDRRELRCSGKNSPLAALPGLAKPHLRMPRVIMQSFQQCAN